MLIIVLEFIQYHGLYFDPSVLLGLSVEARPMSTLWPMNDIQKSNVQVTSWIYQLNPH